MVVVDYGAFAVLLTGAACGGVLLFTAARYSLAAARARTWPDRVIPLHVVALSVAFLARLILGALATFSPVPRGVRIAVMVPADLVAVGALLVVLHATAKRQRREALAKSGKIERRGRA